MHRKTVIDFRTLGERYTFTKPIKELKTRNVEEVADLLAQVESYQEQGYYVVGYVSYEAAPAFEEKLTVHKVPLLGDDLKNAFAAAVEKDKATLKNGSVKSDNTVALKEKIYKKLLQQTNSFKTSIFK